jgi:glycosyltransferase involved in cell wall biosynthesis
MSNNYTATTVIITTPPGTYIPSPKLKDALNYAEDNRTILTATNLSARNTSALEELTKEHNNLTLFISKNVNDSAKNLKKALQISANEDTDGFTIIVDPKAEINYQTLPSIIKKMKDEPDSGIAVVYPDSEAASSTDLVLNMLQNPFYPTVAIIKNKILTNDVLESDDNFDFFALSELLFKIILQTSPTPLPRSLVLRLPSSRSHITNENEQQRMDEENYVLEKYQRLFFKRKFSRQSTQELTTEYVMQVNKVKLLFEEIQKGIMESIDKYDRSIFRYCLLALYSGEVNNARHILETSFSIIGERPALMRLYKQLVLNFPLQKGPVYGPAKVSVVIPLFNQGCYLEEAVMSVVKQTYTNWEMCIIDDGSTDNSYKTAQTLVERISDDRIRLLTQKNRGKGATRNRGIQETDGEFIVTLDSDDMISPDYFAMTVKLMNENPRVGWITPKTLVFGKDNHIAWGDKFNFLETIRACPSPSSSLIRRKAIEQVGLYREDLTNREDAEIWLSLIENGWISVATEHPLFLYRHACRRPGLKNISNIPSKEEITSLHPWWFRLDLSQDMREKAYREYPTYRFSDWFINWDNVSKVFSHYENRDAFLKAMQELKESFPPITKPCRWNSNDDDCYIEVREALYGVRSQKNES